MFFRLKTSGPRRYLQIVENHREGGAVRQQVIATIGRLDELAASGGLAALLASGARFCEQVLLLAALDNPEHEPRLQARRIGAPLVFGRLWQEIGCQAVLEELLAGRAFAFPVEWAIFTAVLRRIMVSGSDRACEKWQADFAIPGAADLDLHHFYRAMAPPRPPGRGSCGHGSADGSARRCRARRRSDTPPRSHRARSRTRSRRPCSRGGATCSAISAWGFPIPPRSRSPAQVGRPWVRAAIPSTPAPTCSS